MKFNVLQSINKASQNSNLFNFEAESGIIHGKSLIVTPETATKEEMEKAKKLIIRKGC